VGVFKRQFSKIFGKQVDKLVKKLINGSKNGATAPRTGLECPHKGPFVGEGWEEGRRQSGCGVSGCTVQGFGFRDQGSGFRVKGLGFRDQGLGFRV
jgi:hypothetical protein